MTNTYKKLIASVTKVGVLALLVIPTISSAQQYDATSTATTTPTTATSTSATTTPVTATSTSATTTATSTDSTDFWKGFLFESELRASNETHDASPAVATGHSGAWFAGDGTDFNYWLSVFSEESVTGAHYHCAAPGQDGPIVVHLANATSTTATSTGKVYGEIGRGYLSDSDIASTGTDCVNTIGYAIDSISDLVRAIRAGLIYTNIHTTTYPAGAARAQLDAYPGWR